MGRTVAPDGKKIEGLRTKAGLSQADLAAKTGIATNTLASVESGKPAYRVTLAQIASELTAALELKPALTAGDLIRQESGAGRSRLDHADIEESAEASGPRDTQETVKASGQSALVSIEVERAGEVSSRVRTVRLVVGGWRVFEFRTLMLLLLLAAGPIAYWIIRDTRSPDPIDPRALSWLPGRWRDEAAQMRGQGNDDVQHLLGSGTGDARWLASFLLGATEGLCQAAGTDPGAERSELLLRAEKIQIELMGNAYTSASARRVNAIRDEFHRRESDAASFDWYLLGRHVALRASGVESDREGAPWARTRTATPVCMGEAVLPPLADDSVSDGRRLLGTADACFSGIVASLRKAR